MMMQRTDDVHPGVCPPLPRFRLLLGKSLQRLGVDRRHDHDAKDRGGRQVLSLGGGARRFAVQSERPEGESGGDDGDDEEPGILRQRVALLDDTPDVDQCQQSENDSSDKKVRPHRVCPRLGDV